MSPQWDLPLPPPPFLNTACPAPYIANHLSPSLPYFSPWHHDHLTHSLPPYRNGSPTRAEFRHILFTFLTSQDLEKQLAQSTFSKYLLNVLINWPYIILKIWNNYRKGSLCLSNLCLSPGVTVDLFALSREKESLSRWFFTDLTNSIYVILKLITLCQNKSTP